MNKITKKILPISLVLAFSLGANTSYSDNVEPSSYINTVFAINLCGPGSTISVCADPVILGTSAAGSTFDLQSIEAGDSAGQMGSMSNASVGTTYYYVQIVLSRAFTVTGEDSPTGTRCRTETDNEFDNTTGNESAVVGVSDTAAAESQVIGIPDTTGLGLNMQGTTSTNGINGVDNATLGKIEAGEPNVKFRFALSQPITIQSGKIPTFTIAFDLATALEFNTIDGNACVATPGSPIVTASFSN